MWGTQRQSNREIHYAAFGTSAESDSSMGRRTRRWPERRLWRQDVEPKANCTANTVGLNAGTTKHGTEQENQLCSRYLKHSFQLC